MFPLQKDDDDGRWGWVGDGAEQTDLARLAEEFAPGDADARIDAAWRARPREDDVEAWDAFFARWDAVQRDLLWNPDRTAGAICVCHLGCGDRRWLVVSGPERGRIWRDQRIDGFDLRPAYGTHGTPLTFSGWYLTWLAEAEAAGAAGVDPR